MSLEWDENEESGNLKSEGAGCQYWIVDTCLVIVTVDAAGPNEKNLLFTSSSECQLYAECLEFEKRAEKLELEVSDLTIENSILEVDVLIMARVIKQLEAQLHGTRQHVTEVNQAKIQESDNG